MPFEIDLGGPPAGYAVGSARADEDVVTISFREFTSTEDGQHFIQRLEGIPSDILKKGSPPIMPSQVDNMLAVIDADGKARVYVNELSQRVRVRVSRPVQAGTMVTKNDIVDVDHLDLGVEISNDAGVVFVFSVGWRKGLFYDFGPISGPAPERRAYDVGAVLGRAYCHVAFQEHFSITHTEWDALFAAKWFPFAGLRHETIDTLLAYIRSGWEPDEKLDDIVSEIKESVPAMLESWRKHPSFAPHLEILERATQRFQDDDFVSCTGLLFPRIEGILRTHHTTLGVRIRPSAANLSRSAVVARIDNERCLLMPHRFEAYLREVYFSDFDPAAKDIDVGRHSVAHGVASVSGFNRKSAVLGLLVVHQLFYCLEMTPSGGSQGSAERDDPEAA